MVDFREHRPTLGAAIALTLPGFLALPGTPSHRRRVEGPGVSLVVYVRAWGRELVERFAPDG